MLGLRLLASLLLAALAFAQKPSPMTPDPNMPRPINGIDLTPAEKSIAWGRKVVNYRAEITVTAIRKAIGSKL